MFRSIAITLTLCLATATAQAALLGRAALTPGGTDYQAYYDDVLNITWMADANLAATEDFGVADIDPGNNTPGGATWFVGQQWIAAMNASNGGTGYLGADDWRLPNTPQPDSSCGTQYQPPGFPSQGYGFGCTGSEFGHLSNVDGIFTASPTPFSNVGVNYWSATEYEPDTNFAWVANTSNGGQAFPFDKDAGGLYLWPVLNGDIAAVPAPPAVWLLGTALAGLGGRRLLRRKISR
jgi:hypothetical protein